MEKVFHHPAGSQDFVDTIGKMFQQEEYVIISKDK